MKIIITGPTGAIGMALIKKCMEEQVHVIAVCHKNSKRTKRIPKSPYVRVAEANLSDLSKINREDILRENDENCDVFYHFAWEGTTGAARNNMPLQISNIQYTIDAVDLAYRLGCKCFIGAGSQAEYGRVEGILKADTPTFPENGYGMAKLCAGQMSRMKCAQLGMKHIWTRILSVYGPYDGENSMIISGLRKMAGNERAGFTPGEQKWDYLYSEDAAEAMYLLGKKGIDGEIYVIGSGKVRQLKDYIYMMKSAVEEQYGISAEPGIGDVPYGDKQVMHLEADITKLKADTGFEPQISFEDGIRKTLMSLK